MKLTTVGLLYYRVNSVAIIISDVSGRMISGVSMMAITDVSGRMILGVSTTMICDISLPSWLVHSMMFNTSVTGTVYSRTTVCLLTNTKPLSFATALHSGMVNRPCSTMVDTSLVASFMTLIMVVLTFTRVL